MKKDIFAVKASVWSKGRVCMDEHTILDDLYETRQDAQAKVKELAGKIYNSELNGGYRKERFSLVDVDTVYLFKKGSRKTEREYRYEVVRYNLIQKKGK
jgi:hypothetical protein